METNLQPALTSLGYRPVFPVMFGATLLLCVSASHAAGECIAGPPLAAPPPEEVPLERDPGSLPLATIDDFQYLGGFALPDEVFGESNMNFSEAVFATSERSLFITGRAADDAIAEFIMPELVNTTRLAELPSTGAPVQNFTSVLDRTRTGNPQAMDVLSGMSVVEGKLVVNTLEYYDADVNSTHTTLVIDDPTNLAGSDVKGFLQLAGGTPIAGWLTELPPIWQQELGKTHLIGHSSGSYPIISRHSVGPSFHAIDAADILNADIGSPIPSLGLMQFDLDTALHPDLYNDSRDNDLWTQIANARYGFIVPGTRTYATFGRFGGGVSGIGYKATQLDGNVCGGPCPFDQNDMFNYFWFWDMNDLLDVRDGKRQSHDIRPYAYGEFEMPFQSAYNQHNSIGGGSFDASTGILYLSIKEANNAINRFANPPVIVGYRVNAAQ